MMMGVNTRWIAWILTKSISDASGFADGLSLTFIIRLKWVRKLSKRQSSVVFRECWCWFWDLLSLPTDCTYENTRICLSNDTHLNIGVVNEFTEVWVQYHPLIGCQSYSDTQWSGQLKHNQACENVQASQTGISKVAFVVCDDRAAAQCFRDDPWIPASIKPHENLFEWYKCKINTCQLSCVWKIISWMA